MALSRIGIAGILRIILLASIAWLVLTISQAGSGAEALANDEHAALRTAASDACGIKPDDLTYSGISYDGQQFLSHKGLDWVAVSSTGVDCAALSPIAKHYYDDCVERLTQTQVRLEESMSWDDPQNAVATFVSATSSLNQTESTVVKRALEESQFSGDSKAATDYIRVACATEHKWPA